MGETTKVILNDLTNVGRILSSPLEHRLFGLRELDLGFMDVNSRSCSIHARNDMRKGNCIGDV